MRVYLLIVLICSCAGYYFYQQWQTQPKNIIKPSTEKSEPDYKASGLSIKLFNKTGVPSVELKAQSMAYYQKKAVAEFEQTEYNLYNDNAEIDWQLHAQKSVLHNNNDLELSHQVTLSSNATTHWLTNLSTEQLNVDIANKTIETMTPINIHGERFNLTGKGISANLNQNKFEIKDEIKAVIIPN